MTAYKASWLDEQAQKRLIGHALAYARRGWRVLPLWWISYPPICACHRGQLCEAPGKHPIISTGVRAASADVAQIYDWWGRWPLANIGVATGAASGVVVVDVDVGEGKSGRASMAAAIRANGRLPLTIAARTGSGGVHLFFRPPGGGNVPNRVGFLPGVDMRGDGGYVVVAPSAHACGESYSWPANTHPAKTPAAALPLWLISPAPVAVSAPRLSPGKASPHLATIHQRIGQIGEGARNDRLFRIAARLVADGHGEDDIRGAIETINTNCCKPPLREREISNLVRSAVGRYKRGS